MDQDSLVVLNIDESGSMGCWWDERRDLFKAIAGGKQLISHMKNNHTNASNVEV